MRLSRSLVVTVGLGVVAFACSDGPIGPKEPDLPASGRLGVTPKQDTIFISDSLRPPLQLTPTINIGGSEVATPQAPASVKWSSLDTAVAIVDGAGSVTPRQLGTATIRAEAGGQDADARITVAYQPAGLQLTATTLTGVVGDTARVRAQLIADAGGVVSGVTYTLVSSDPSIAVLDPVATGQARVRFLRVGSVQIRATALDQGAAVTIAVQAPRIVVTPATITPVAGDTLTLAAQAVGLTGALLPTAVYMFTSSDSTIAALDTIRNGAVRVRFKRAGSATVQATALQGQTPLAVVVQPARVTATATPARDVVVGDTARITTTVANLSGARPATVTYAFTPVDPTVVAVDSVAVGTVRVRFLKAGAAAVRVVVNDSTQVVSFGAVAPLAVAGGAGAASVAGAMDAGGDHTCGIVGPGRLYCWGLGATGQLASVGDSLCFNDAIIFVVDTVRSVSRPSPARCELSPKRAAPAIAFTAVSAGDSLSCGIAAAGQAYCWGAGTAGQLGTGRAASSTTPQALSSRVAFSSITAGGYHACGIAASGAWCWGEDSVGQLGDASLRTGANSTTPIPVVVPEGLTPRQLPLTQVSAGFRHSCGVTGAGAAWCWGENSRGQLGRGDTTRADPTNVAPPTAVVGGITFASISAGTSHTCGVAAGGAVYCWGSNIDGQLGNGTVGGPAVDSPVLVLGLTAAQVSAGLSHTCATDRCASGVLLGQE